MGRFADTHQKIKDKSGKIHYVKKGETIESTERKRGNIATPKDIAAANYEPPAQRQVQQQVTPNPTIHLQGRKELTGIGAAREKDTFLGHALKFMTSPKTTIGLGATLAGLLTFGGSAGATAGAGGVITRTGTMMRYGKEAMSLTSQRAFIGKSITPSIAKLFTNSATRTVATRFVTNPKTMGLTTSWLSKMGIGTKAAGTFIAAVGTYPFAGFLKEEAVQSLNIPIQTAIYNGDLEAAKKAVADVDELIANKNNIYQKIPFVNVLDSLNAFFDSAQKTNDQWKNIIGTVETEGSAGSKAAKQKLQATADLAHYYDLIRAKKFDEASAWLAQLQQGT